MLRPLAQQIFNQLPDDQMQSLIDFMVGILAKDSRLQEKKVALDSLKNLAKKIPNLDDNAAKSKYLEEKLK